jgi:hypothetical protein
LDEANEQQATLRQLVLAAENAFDALGPALDLGAPKLSKERRSEAVIASLILNLCERYAARAELPTEPVKGSKLAELALPVSQLPPLEALAYKRAYEALLAAAWGSAEDPRLPAERVSDIGAVYEALLVLPSKNQGSRGRKPTGSYYTPPPLAAQVCETALVHHLKRARKPLLEVRVLDPAVGAGVFLIQACRVLAEQLVKERAGELSTNQALGKVASACLYGVDVNPLSVAVTELCLWLLVGDRELEPASFSNRLRHGNALIGIGFETGQALREQRARVTALQAEGLAAHAFDWREAFPEVERGFDVVVGNPPWVAYAGRSAQPLAPPLRKYYGEAYAAWRGFPTLHGLFVERAASLSPDGTLALLLPSPVADLGGYRNVRSALTRTHRVCAGLTEFGQDAFVGVTQPCFALVADASAEPVPTSDAWQLSERQWADGAAERVEVPEVLRLLLAAPSFAARHFGEMGFQTTRVASETLLLRAEAPDATHKVPLLEGRNIHEFSEGSPRLYLCDDLELLKRAKCRLRPVSEYQRVAFVVRQTAAVPIAALHQGLPFRNSLLGGFASDDLSAPVLVALLNSSLYRALHLAAQRDARQAAFPQVKISHLRALPQPPPEREAWHSLAQLALNMTEHGVSEPRKNQLDALVFRLFAIPEDHQRAVLRFLQARAPRYAPSGQFDDGPPHSSLEPVRRALVGVS